MAVLNYRALCETLWGCAAEIKAAHEKAVPAQLPKRIAKAAAIMLVTGILCTVFTDIAALGIVVGAICAYLGFPSPDTSEQIGAVKARYIEALLTTKRPLAGPGDCADYVTLKQQGLLQSDVGTGLLSSDRVLIFFATGASDPLPGLGWVQARDLYICPPNSVAGHRPAQNPQSTEANVPLVSRRALEGTSDPHAGDHTESAAVTDATVAHAVPVAQVTEAAAHKIVRDRVTLNQELELLMKKVADALCHGDSKCIVRTGHLVIVDSDGVQKSSHWLDENGRPLLYKERPKSLAAILELETLQLPNGDADASGRTFFAFQVYLPDFQTLVTLAARVFLAASSASIEIFVVSLGPPSVSSQTLRERHATHKLITPKRDNPETGALMKPEKPEVNPQVSTLAAHLMAWDARLRGRQDPLKTAVKSDVLKNLFDRTERRHGEANAAAEVNRASGHYWVGHYTRRPNWRESTSLTMPHTLFESPEFKASLRSIYSNTATTLLRGVARLGYNIDAYRDARGNISFVATQFVDSQRNESVSVEKQVTNNKREVSIKQGDHGTVNANQGDGKTP